MIIWSIQYFGVRARRAAWQPKAVLESHKIAPKCPKFAASDLFPRASITERSFGVARKRTKMSQICRRWFISTHKYYRKKFWSRTKSHQNVPNLPPVIYFHAHVLQKEVLESHEITPKCPKFAAGDLFSRACICEFRWQFLLISLLRSNNWQHCICF